MYHCDAARVERKTIILLSGVTQEDEEDRHIMIMLDAQQATLEQTL